MIEELVGGTYRSKPYKSTLTSHRKTIWRCYYRTAKEAELAYKDARKKHYGEFA